MLKEGCCLELAVSALRLQWRVTGAPRTAVLTQLGGWPVDDVDAVLCEGERRGAVVCRAAVKHGWLPELVCRQGQ